MDQDAANFLKERIRRQAQAEGMPLSTEEETLLELASAGRKDEARDALKRLKEHESVLEFGRRMAGLLMRAYEEDLKSDPQAREKYAQHSRAFGGDSGLFSAVMPLVVGHSKAQQPPSQQRISPESSGTSWMLLLIFLVAMGMILWFVISRR